MCVLCVDLVRVDFHDDLHSVMKRELEHTIQQQTDLVTEHILEQLLEDAFSAPHNHTHMA